jgi:glycosyltransferase involved in cell wall biosynthesis
MNIGIDSKRIFFNHSGLGNYSRRFYHALARNLTDDKFFLYSPKPVAGSNPYLAEVIIQNSKIVFPEGIGNKLFGGALWRSMLINNQLAKDKVGIFYGLSNEIPFGRQHAGLIKVVIIHDLIFIRYPNLYPAIDRAIYRKKTVYACKNADHIIAASEQTKRDIINFYHVAPEKISVIYPGTDPSFYADTCTDSREFFSTGRKYIISIGAITPRKNLLKTVQAFHLVKDKFNLDLVVIGTATGLGKSYLQTIMKFIDDNGLAGRVHFLGNVPYKYVPDLCRKAELMIYPSQFEGFGMPIVEGLFSRIPVITSKGGCFPEAGGDGAVYVDPDDFEEIADVVSELMESETMRKELISKGLHHVEKFRQDQIEAVIVKFHQEAVAASRD